VDPKQIVAAGYDQRGGTDDGWARRGRIEERARYQQVLLDRLPEGAAVLDLGCGSGARKPGQGSSRGERGVTKR